MKSKCSFILKTSIALILTALMIFGSVSTVLAATVDMASTGGWTWETTWYVNNSISSVWGNDNTSPVATRNNGILTYIYYLKKDDTAFDMAFYCSGWGNDGRVIPSDDAQSKALTTSNQNCKQGYNGTNGSWKVDPSKLTNSNQYYRYTITCDLSQNNYWGAMKYSATALTNISPTLTVDSTGTVGSAITLTGGATETGKVGTLTKTYQYSTDNGSTWNDLSSNSYTPTAAGTVKFRYKVSDGGVVASGASTGINARTARIEYSDEKSCVVSAAPVTYNNIAVAAQGTTDGSTYTSLSGASPTISATSYTTGSSALNITAGTVSGYTFAQWKVTAGSGTIGSSTTANTTFTPSASNTTVTAQFKKNYTITKNTPTSGTGTISIDNTSRVAGQQYVVTLAPAAGYKVDTFTVGGVDKKSSISNNKYTGTASGSNATIAVNVTYAPITDMQLYIAGRFRVRPSAGSSSWTTTYASGSDWNATSTNIPFTYVSGTTYKVDTYASLKELSAKPTNNQDPWFFVYDKTNSKAWHPTTQNRELGTTTEYNLTTNTDTYNVRFNSSSDDSPVTIYFDYNTKRLWYTIPDLYDVTVGSATGGSVTASPARAEAGTSVTLTISPSTGYQLSSITAKDSSNATVTLSGTGNTRTFTMPAKNVTVTPVFEKITWSGLTAVGKYSTTAENDASYSNDFPTGSAPNITIAATSATQLDGVRVTAPATDPTGYVFAGWTATSGSFTNDANKDTTFKPTAANAVAIAKYKKIFTITSSVDNTGTGAGTVTTSKTSVEAGGSYDINATAKSGSAIESIMVGSTNKGTNATTTISSVSADQVVKVKFKSNVYLRGGSIIGTNWTTGDAMTSNADGTEFTKTYENVAGSSSGTEYQFKLFVGDYNNDGTATINITGGTSTGTCTHQSDGNKNYVLTLKKAANVTVKSNGTKITEIKVVPANSAKYAVTFKKAANTTITGQYEGTNFSTAEADATVQVYEGDEISFTVAAASGYHISALTSGTTPAFSPAVTKTYKLSNVTAAKTITPTAAADVNVTAVTNKKSRGTVTVDKSKSFKGDTVVITVTPLAGTLKSLTATYSGGETYEWKSGNWNVAASTTGAAPASALMSVLVNPFKSTEIAATGAVLDEATVAAMPDLVPVGATQTINMVMQEDKVVTINAVFDPYSAESTWYYNGYDTSGNAVSGYHGKQMTESMVSGEKFSYYHVEGRTGPDQLMTVSNGVPSSGTRYVYFVRPNNYGDGWSASNNPKAHFWKNGGQDYDTWPGTEMSWQWNNDYGQGVYKIAIPDGADRVSFNDATNNGQHQTLDIDLTTTSGAYYVGEWNSTYSKYDYGTWDTGRADQGWVASGTEYFYQNSTHNGDYTGDFNTKGFHNHYTASKEFAKPKDLGTNTGDYYINVLYPNTTYTINGVTKKTGTNPMIIWSAEPLAGDDENVTVYAKDGAIRAETFGSTYANIADTKIYAADGTTTVGTKQNGSIANQTYETYKAAKGDTLVIKTTIGATDSSTLSNAADLKAKYYVRGFCINGEVPALLEWNSDGLYTLTYKIPEDTEITKFEITPIYYLKDTEANPIVTYRVTGFTDELKAVGTGKPGWGDTLYTYPYYGKLGGQNNAFGAYPGQPMVYYKGQYQMQIPQKSTAWDPYQATAATVNNTTVSGVTMSNGYWDSVHKSIMGYGDNSTSADHVQTYDYGDFYKIFNEKAPVNNIVFDFKYRTTKHNLVNDNTSTSIAASTLTSAYGTNGNGFELLTNFHGKNVDLFGNPLSGDAADPSKTTPIYVVSIGGVNDNVSGVENIAGYYATEWRVYAPNTPTSLTSTYKKVTVGTGNTAKSSIPPEVLVLNDDDNTSFNNTTYPSADANHNVTDWKAMYTELKQYAGHPVMISYEAADAQQGQGMYYTGTGGATRNDGRWLYSKNGENITSNIKIQYSNNNGDTYTELDTVNPQVTGLSAYFTNTEAYEKMTYATTIDPDKTFDFEAKTSNANYKFVGWYMADGTKITSDNASHTERSGSYTFVAKFMEVQSGQLIMSHSVAKGAVGSIDYQGAGDVTIAVDVIDPDNGDTIVKSFPATASDITLDDKIIKSDSNYKIKVTLTSTPQNNNALGTTVLAQPDGQTKFFSGASDYTTSTDQSTRTDSFTFNVSDLFTTSGGTTTQDVKSIIYHSYFQQYIFNYDINFEYYDRFDTVNGNSHTGTKKVYNVKGTLTNAEAAEYVYKDTVTRQGVEETHRFLKKDFVQTIAPYESNFNEKLTWNFDTELDFGNEASGSSYVYSVEGHYGAIQEDVNTRTAIFALPYEHDAKGAATGGDEVAEATTPNLVLTDLKYETVIKADGEYITAPSKVGDKYFQYWSINTTKTEDQTQTKGDEVARCYFKSFNFMAYDNYYIEPVYDTKKYDYNQSGTFTNITYLDTTRNQWNTNGEDHYTMNGTKKTASATDRAAAADLLYNDFMLNYNYNGKDIYLAGDDVANITDLGYIVERVQLLDENQDGTRDTTMSKYADKGMTAEQAMEIATSYNTNKGTQNGITKYMGTGTDSRIARYSVNKTALDNKNRIEIYDAYYNAAGWDKNDKDFVAHYAYRNYVYKVYTYMVVDGVTKVSDNPAYFTMYNEAMKTADKMMAN